MKRVLIVVAYDGTAYHGWQMQPNAVTIEQIINESLTKLLGEDIEVIGQAGLMQAYMLREMLRYLILIQVYRLRKSVMRLTESCLMIL